MIKFINEELFSFAPIEAVDRFTGKSYSKIKVFTSNKIYRKIINDNDQNKTISPTSTLIPVIKELLKISSSMISLNDSGVDGFNIKTIDLTGPMSLKVDMDKYDKPMIDVRCHGTGDDHLNMFVIAFPFNGMIKHIPKSPQYRIYKGQIVTSNKPFFFNTKRYRKILYLVIEVNKNLFDPTHKYHTDVIDIKLESFGLYTDRETNTQKTNCEVYNLSFTDKDGSYNDTWEYFTEDKAILIDYKDPLWVTHVFSNNQGAYNRDSNKYTNSKTSHRSSTNVNNTPREKLNAPYQKDKQDSLDDMMAMSGMFESKHNRREDQYNKNKSSKSKKKKGSKNHQQWN